MVTRAQTRSACFVSATTQPQCPSNLPNETSQPSSLVVVFFGQCDTHCQHSHKGCTTQRLFTHCRCTRSNSGFCRRRQGCRCIVFCAIGCHFFWSFFFLSFCFCLSREWSEEKKRKEKKRKEKIGGHCQSAEPKRSEPKWTKLVRIFRSDGQTDGHCSPSSLTSGQWSPKPIPSSPFRM